jgi:resorcinol 4-hydroxylase (NADPH)
MCSGIRDAANLAWKLDLVLAGRAADALLDTYASERVPHVSAVIDVSMALGRVICIADPAEAAARDDVMVSAAASGRQTTPPPPLGIGPGVVHAGDPHAGKLFVQARVQRGAECGLFDDVVGGGWALVSAAGDPLAALQAQARDYFAALGGVAAHVGAAAPVRDLDGTYARWFAETGVGVVLQRPDFYVFGTGATVEDADALVRALQQSLGRPQSAA